MVTLQASYTSEEFAAVVRREGDTLELKTAGSPKSLANPMVAFSNGAGGVILLGVTDDRKVVGCRHDQGVEDKIHQAALEAHGVGRYSIHGTEVGGVPIVAIVVQPAAEGFAQTSDGRILVRRGGRNVALIGAEAWQHLSQRALTRFETVDSGVASTEISPEALESLREAFGWSEDLKPRLKERGLMLNSDTLTFAGALLLTDPVMTLGSAKFHVDVRVYDDAGTTYRHREIVGGTLPGQLTGAVDLVGKTIGSDLVVTGLYRYDLPRLPVPVIRETVANAVAHRSYEADHSPIIIEIRPTSVVVRSPGRFPGHVTKRTLRQAQAARNPTVIDALRHFGLTEDAGRGIDVIEDEMSSAMLDEPSFDEVGEFVEVTLPMRGPIAPRERAWVNDLERDGAIKAVDRVLLVNAARGRRITNSTARELTGLDSIEARQSLRRLRDQGLLVQHGARGGASYTLADLAAPHAAQRMSAEQIDDLIVAQAAIRPLSNQAMRELTGLDRADVRAIAKRLVDEGRLVRSGERRGTRYSASGTRT